MKILIATANLGKVKEFQDRLGSKFECCSNKDFRTLPPEVEENGETYYENSLKKALQYFSVYQVPVIADDSGIEVDGLSGAPGVYSARFGGEDLSWPQRWAHLLNSLKGVEEKGWKARFRCVLTYFDGHNVPTFFEGCCEGKILPKPEGDKGFGYDPIFYSDELKKSFGIASLEEKQAVSHRGRAISSFLSSRLDQS